MSGRSPGYVYVFYRGEEPEFTGSDTEAAEYYKTNVDHIHWLATPTARRRAEKSGGDQRLYAEKILEAVLMLPDQD